MSGVPTSGGASPGRELLQLRFHFGERDRCGDGPLEAAVMDACARRGVAAAATLRGVEGFGAKHRLRTDRLLTLSEDTPLVTTAVGEGEDVEALAAEIEALAGEGLIALEPVLAGGAGASAGAAGGKDDEDTIEATVWGPRRGPASPHLGAVAAFHRHGAEAATVLLGVDGVLDGERRRARFFAGNRGVPALTVATGGRAAIEAALGELEMAPSLVTVAGVERNRRHATEKLHGDPTGRAPAAGTRVTLVTSEVATRGHHPLYVELIYELRRQDAAGATALRGVWGFRGADEPRGDRVSALRRDVPIVVEAVDSPERAERWRELALRLAGEEDVVGSRSIPRLTTLG